MWKIGRHEGIISLINRETVPFTTGKSVFYCPGPMYRLEKQMEPNVAVDLDSTLESQSTLEFCLVRENSKYAR